MPELNPPLDVSDVPAMSEAEFDALLRKLDEPPPAKSAAPWKKAATNGSALDPARTRVSLLHAGYVPTPCEGKEPILTKWTERTSIADETIEQWRKQHPGATNTGVLTFKNPVVDIDIWDGAVVAEVERVVREFASNSGVLLTRTGRAPKLAIPFRLDGTRFKKKATPVFLDADSRANKLEILADGQQFIVCGIHPDTGAPYTWNQELRLVSYDQLPPISEADADRLIEQVTEILRATGWQQKADKPKPTISQRAASRAPSSRREQAYGQAALRNAAAELASTTTGDRNNVLNAKAFSLGRQVAAGRLNEDEVRQELLKAAEANGSIKDDGLRAAQNSIASGLGDGMQQPAPPLEERPAEQQKEQSKEEDATDREALLLAAWLRLALAPRDYLLGDVICTTSRWLIYGATGVGKTLFAAEMAGAMAAAAEFLGWIGRRPARVMYLDGELPAETFKERMELIAERYGADIPLYGYNRDVLGPDEMPPLNTEAGERWLKKEIGIVHPDAIFADSIMSLLIGNMAEEESWTPMKPMVRWLSAQRICQVWLHHTGHDTSKSYGTKTREWELDTVLALTPAGDDGSIIQADFTKARLRTPANYKQFTARNLTRGPDGWTATDADVSRKGGSVGTEVAQVKGAILRAYDHLADGIILEPGFDNKPVRKVLADAIRDEVKSRGFLDTTEKGAITASSRTVYRRAKNILLGQNILIEDGARCGGLELSKPSHASAFHSCLLGTRR
jgi:hypothetical protein